MNPNRMPDWFKEALGWAHRQDHYDKVDSWSWLGRLVHLFVRCPACRYRKRHEKETRGE